MKTVLVIDDDEMFRFILAQWLKEEGFHPITAEDGFEGVRLAQAHQPDLIFCDFYMPAINGLEVLEQLHNNLNTSHIPFFFLTSETNLQLGIMHHLGAKGVISKGAEIRELHRALTSIKT